MLVDIPIILIAGFVSIALCRGALRMHAVGQSSRVMLGFKLGACCAGGILVALVFCAPSLSSLLWRSDSSYFQDWSFKVFIALPLALGAAMGPGGSIGMLSAIVSKKRPRIVGCESEADVKTPLLTSNDPGASRNRPDFVAATILTVTGWALLMVPILLFHY